MDLSIVEYFGNDGGHSCGYCKSDESSFTHGMWAHQLTCQDYQDLLNRGWRRSGKYCYKPTMEKTCCPHYTIRCDVTNIKISKSQKKVIKRFNTYLATGKRPADVENELAGDSKKAIKQNIQHAPSSKVSCNNRPSMLTTEKHLENIHGADPNKPRCRKAKEVRREKKKLKQTEVSSQEKTGADQTASVAKENKNKEKTIEQLFEEFPSDLVHTLEVKLVRCSPQSEEFRRDLKKECKLFQKYQTTIHNDTPEDSGEKQFRRFLVDGPLLPVEKDSNNEVPSPGLGAFHQLYYIDGKLIAVGVLDILPNCVSSKYFFYDPDYGFLSLGTYSALREIYFIRSLHKECASMKYYYMGYYIHSCPKMKYKGRYDQSYLLCPETYTWQPHKACVPKLDVNKYSRLEEDETITTPPIDVMKTLVLYRSQALPFSIYLSLLKPHKKDEQTKVVTEYTKLAGVSASSMLLYRS